jgi:hypothetical protein
MGAAILQILTVKYSLQLDAIVVSLDIHYQMHIAIHYANCMIPLEHVSAAL